MHKRISVTPDSVRCSTCMLGDLCLPLGMSQRDRQVLDQIIKERIRLPKGSSLFHAGDTVTAVYGIRSGSIKTQLEDPTGKVQITGFLLPGEIVGLDGLLQLSQVSHAQALETTEVCVIRVDEMDGLAPHLPSLQQQFRRLLSKEIGRSQQMTATLALLRSEQRVAAFLLNVSQRLAALGYSAESFVLRMSRAEIGNYLGLTLETVSRWLSHFAQDGLIRLRQREITLLQPHVLQQMAGTACD